MLRRADGTYTRVDWDTALSTVADGFRRVVERDGPGAIAFYLSGQLLTEDYYVANKLAKGFLGSANVDTNSRLCMASTVAGHRRAFGEDVVPGSYEDLDQANLLVLVGANTAWCHPVLFQRMTRNRRERGAKIVVIDPRRTATGDEADLFLAIAPGTDTALFAGLLVHLADVDALDRNYIEANTSGFAAALARARDIAPDIAATAAATGLDEGDVARFFQLFRSKEKVVTCFSQGVNQSAQGTDKVNAIINCHLATGRIGRPGMGPFSLTGQPNAMGGREAGGLANMLAAHMGFAPDEVDRVRRFWNAPNMAEREGLKAVADVRGRGARRDQGALGDGHQSRGVVAACRRHARGAEEARTVRRVREHAPQRHGVGRAARAASRRRLGREGRHRHQFRALHLAAARLPAVAGRGQARLVDRVRGRAASRLCASNSPIAAPRTFFASMPDSRVSRTAARASFDLGGLAAMSDEDYDALEPVQWPVRANDDSRSARLFADGRFSTPDRKARFIAPEQPALSEKTTDEFPLRLNTGRLRDQWHTMTRTGQSPTLGAHKPEPFVEVHPLDAKRFGLAHGGFARLTSRHGSCILKVVTSAGQQQGSIFAPIHWSNSNASSACIGDLVAPQTDPFSGQPEAKATPVSIEPAGFAYRGFALAREPFAFPEGTWWTQVALPGTTGFLFASNDTPDGWRSLAPSLFPEAALTEFVDRKRGLYRAAAFVDGRLEGAVFLGPADAPPQWGDLRQMVGGPGIAESGQVVCACFGVGVAAIAEAVASGNAASVEDIAKALRAGNKCGTCLPEIRSIVGHELASRNAKDRVNDRHTHDHAHAR